MAPVVDRYPIIEAVRDGAIAQLGERVVRNDEVGGSIPPGSTSLRRLRLLRLGTPSRSEGCHAIARRATAGSINNLISTCFGPASPIVAKAARRSPTAEDGP